MKKDDKITSIFKEPEKGKKIVHDGNLEFRSHTVFPLNNVEALVFPGKEYPTIFGVTKKNPENTAFLKPTEEVLYSHPGLKNRSIEDILGVGPNVGEVHDYDPTSAARDNIFKIIEDTPSYIINSVFKNQVERGMKGTSQFGFQLGLKLGYAKLSQSLGYNNYIKMYQQVGTSLLREFLTSSPDKENDRILLGDLQKCYQALLSESIKHKGLICEDGPGNNPRFIDSSELTAFYSRILKSVSEALNRYDAQKNKALH
ncbi:hypothetical protein KY366_01975 [Candidatus Woesearchaeota archaeon]|nr:hypothetical protein [Candidatus Woesearchaeota archaeon]